MPKENYTISAFHGGLNSSSDPRDIRNEDLSVASGVDVSRVGKVSIMNGEEPHFSTGVTAERPVDAFSEVQPGYGLFSYKTDALGTSSQSNNYLRSEQVQYGSAGGRREAYDNDANKAFKGLLKGRKKVSVASLTGQTSSTSAQNSINEARSQNKKTFYKKVGVGG